MKILHISIVRELSSGQRKQLCHEYNAIKKLGVDWETIALHTCKVENKTFEKTIPKLFRPVFLRNLYGWIYMLKASKKYDLILNRHMTFDPFVLIFGWFIKNRMSVHHSKEVEELKLINNNFIGKIVSQIERLTGKVNLIQVRAAIGVTREIALYESGRYFVPTFVYANAIDLDEIVILDDRRKKGINIAFVCGTFSSWHGLDLLLSSIEINSEYLKDKVITIHLIGKVLEAELKRILYSSTLSKFIKIYGLVFDNAYESILSTCDIGLSSLALHRKGLKEASTLKVREYLAFGLPVYSGHIDAAIPKDFSYYHFGEADVLEIAKYAISMKNTQRNFVRKNSKNYISKDTKVLNLLKAIEEQIFE